MKIGNEPSFVNGVPVRDQLSEDGKGVFKPCIDSNISIDGEIDGDVKIRIARTANAFGHLRKSIFTSHCLPVNVK